MWRFGWLADEALGRAEERSIECFLACNIDCLGLSEVDLVGGHQPDAGVMMLFVVPGKEPAAEGACRIDGFKPPGEFRLILQRPEVGLPRTGCRLRCAACYGI